MNLTLGKRIANLRRQKELRQEDLAERLNVSSQAVSKWENDLTCPDISLLPRLASILGVTVDELLTGKTDEPNPQVKILPAEERKSVNEMMLRIVSDKKDGERVRVNIPMALVKVAIDMGMELHQISNENDELKKIDLKQILELVHQGVIGNLLEVESSDGDTVRIFVE
ncbi:MAG: helix-turn-helix transcriptional regulator [Clostridia bacterium]|nr:helix-turn-helix transcriptional regulator [Clostridia bacterium]